MHRRLIIAVLTVVFLSGAWPAAAWGRATTETLVFRTPVSETVEGLACVDEPVFLTGEIQTVAHTRQDTAGGTHVVEITTNVNLQGAGQVTGQVYRVVGSPFGNTSQHFTDPFPSTQTRVTTANVIRQGQPDPGLTFQIHILEHVTVNKDGEPTAVVTEFRERCV
jgi:hypothetical protein